MSAPVVLQLLQREDVFIEVLLKLLIGVVDIKLLKSVHLDRKMGNILQHLGLVHTQVM